MMSGPTPEQPRQEHNGAPVTIRSNAEINSSVYDSPLTSHSISPPATRALLNYSELRSIETWKELIACYQSRGLNFPTDQSCLDQVKQDWRQARLMLQEQALISDIPDTYPRTTLSLKGSEISIFGMAHHHGMHPDVKLLLYRDLSSCPFLISEQNLGRAGFGMFSHGLDLPDHFARGLLSALAQFELHQARSLWQGVKRTAQWVSTPFRSHAASPEDERYIAPTTEKGAQFAQLQKSLGFSDPLVAKLSRMFMVVPGDWLSDLPVNIELAHKHERGIPYTHSQARSAYMAEFLRHWDLPKSLEPIRSMIPEDQFSEISTQKQILCGKAHELEIAYFLKHGSLESKVTERAQRVAHTVNEHGLGALSGIFLKEHLKYQVALAAGAIAKGGLLGWGLMALT